MGAVGMISVVEYKWDPVKFMDKEGFQHYALVVLNRPIEMQTDAMMSLWNRATVRLTVDGGTTSWLKFIQERLPDTECLHPDLITGDLDSISSEALAHFTNAGVEVVRTPDQDETDFTKALRVLRAHLANKQLQVETVVAVCETSGRLDQILANMNTLYKAAELLPGVAVLQRSSDSLTWLLAPGKHHITVPEKLVCARSWCSLVPLGRPAMHVTTSGLQWNLKNQPMEFGAMVSTSNTYSGATVVTVRTDSILVWSMGLGSQHCNS